ncbi:MAG TPA: ImmA/IrrE family metallo-endopeptidase [Candidatus Wunengus sp. YC60]|uniref:ImmA/IrrE family metallo-endopeptidase n=1 Tax=Candidatus Wunengus sp. YC60 TaxID=3367697 RepID=UPI0040267FFE
MKKDDSNLRPEELSNIKYHAKKLLDEAGVFNHFPTPINEIVKTAKLVVNNDLSLGDSEGILSRFTGNIGKIARPHLHGLKKLLGLLHVPSGEIIIDHSQHENKKTFIKLHETGHGFLPHQRKMYEFMEDGQFELDPETEDLFEREANNFACETLFQLELYEKMAADYITSIKTPIDLSKKFGSSIYASMRRYTQTHFAPLVLAIYDIQKEITNIPCFCLRREPIYSTDFIKKFGFIKFPNPATVQNHLGSIMKSAKLQTYHKYELNDLNGNSYACSLHVFNNSYEVFVMLIPEKKITHKTSAPITISDGIISFLR